MFDAEFFPTSDFLLQDLIDYFGCDLTGKIVYDPQGGKGNIIDFAKNQGALDTLASELHPELRMILQNKCTIIGEDSFNVNSIMISHVDYIIMNPPFSNADKHILHAFEIAPSGCKIIAICNAQTVHNDYTKTRRQLSKVIEEYGSFNVFDNAFQNAERSTNVQVAGILIEKPGERANEFDGFFVEDDPEEAQENALMGYNVVRDLVNRYVAAVKLYDEQLQVGAKMNALIGSFYKDKNDNKSSLSFTCTENGKAKLRNEFKKDLQRSAWMYIFSQMDMDKHTTRGLKEQINNFVTRQLDIPFTMKNVYRMLEIVQGTTTQRMDKALEEVFDKITSLHDDNRYQLEGWKTNSHFLVGKKFIVGGMCYQDQRFYKGKKEIQINYGRTNYELMEDFVKALCYITGDNYELLQRLDSWINHQYKIITDKEVHFFNNYDSPYNSVVAKKKELYEKGIACELINCRPVYGQWFDWAYFRCKAFKKGSMHFEFKDEELWARFNQRIAKIKGFTLFEGKEQTDFQKRKTGRPVNKNRKAAA